MMLKSYLAVQKTFHRTEELKYYFCVSKTFCITLRWLVGLTLLQLEQKKTQLPFIILIENLKPNTLQAHKKYMEIFEFKVHNLRIQTLAAKM